MQIIAAMLDGREPLTALRRSLPRGAPQVVACRTPATLLRTLEQRVVDAVVVSRRRMSPADATILRQAFPAISLIAWGQFRPDDGPLISGLAEAGFASLVVEGVDDAVAGEMVYRLSLTERRRRALADGPRMLRLDEPLQLEVWHAIIRDTAQPTKTAELARSLGLTREHLSRRFGSGGAPNIKRVVDLARVATAAQLLANPAYTTADVSRLLGFSSSSHLSRTAQRVAGVSASALGRVAIREILRQFARGKTRSRL